ncbi:hypothetical protein HK102_006862 [Quaeritorhiza haematococci]|nr:hypothetical protein HK102_006862 [Quaeritorhiza haematococci]
MATADYLYITAGGEIVEVPTANLQTVGHLLRAIATDKYTLTQLGLGGEHVAPLTLHLTPDGEDKLKPGRPLSEIWELRGYNDEHPLAVRVVGDRTEEAVNASRARPLRDLRRTRSETLNHLLPPTKKLKANGTDGEQDSSSLSAYPAESSKGSGSLLEEVGTVGLSKTHIHDPEPEANKPSDSRLRRWEAINKALAIASTKMNEKTETDESSDSPSDSDSDSPHDSGSSLTWTHIRKILGSSLKRVTFPSQPLPPSTLQLLHTYTKQVYKSFGLLVLGPDTMRLHFIAPILICVCSTLNNVDILVDEDYHLQRETLNVKGRCEFILQFQRKKKRVCVVLAEKGDFEVGLAKGVLACEAVAEEMKGKEGGSLVVGGIVTSFTRWFFFRCSEEGVEMDRDDCCVMFEEGGPSLESLGIVAGKVCGLLTDLLAD